MVVWTNRWLGVLRSGVLGSVMGAVPWTSGAWAAPAETRPPTAVPAPSGSPEAPRPEDGPNAPPPSVAPRPMGGGPPSPSFRPPDQAGTPGSRATRVADPFTASGGPAPEINTTDMSPTEDLSRTWTYSQRGDVAPRYVDMTPERVSAVANPIGFYSGVSVANAGAAPPVPPKASATGPVLTWTGYEPKRPGSRIFFQFSLPVDHRMTQEGLVVQVRFPGATVSVRNNMRPLELTYHATVVKRVRVKRSGSDLLATIELKRPGAPTVRTVPADNGYTLVVLEFGE